jgi:hypothetical protein
MNSFGRKYTMHVGAERFDPSVDLSDATPALFGSQPASVRGSSSVEPVSSGFSSGRPGTIAPFARCTRPHPPLDQPTLNQLASFWDDQ